MRRLVILLVGCTVPHIVAAQDIGPAAKPAEEKTPNAVAAQQKAAVENGSFNIKPVLVDSKDKTSTSLGIDYEFKKSFKLWEGKDAPAGQIWDEKEVDSVKRSGDISVLARGTLMSDADKNPNKLMDFNARANIVFNALPAYTKLGFIGTYETDQSRQNKQKMYGLAASSTAARLFIPNGIGSVIATYGTVDPTNDVERKKILGTTESYRRYTVELSYSFIVDKRYNTSVDLNVRHYKELNAPAPIEDAKLDEQTLALVRVNHGSGAFVQYAAGKLPFDQRTTRSVRVGWNFQLAGPTK